MGFEFTPQQKKAIYTNGDSILVSAAAGSGKTAVLVERVLDFVINKGVDINRLMILTFTEAAASEMRKKIITKLYNMEQNDFIKRQIVLSRDAKISTIHSACLETIKEYSYMLDIDMDINIIDESELSLLEEQILDDFIDEIFEKYDENEDIKEFVDLFSSSRSDEKLKEAIKTVFNYLENEPFDNAFSQKIISNFQKDNLFDCFKDAGLKQYIDDEINSVIKIYDDMFIFIKNNNVILPKLNAFYAEERELISKIGDNNSFDDYFNKISNFKFKTQPRLKPEEAQNVNNEDIEYLKKRREEAKLVFYSLKKDIFYQNEQSHLEENKIMAKILKTFFGLVFDYKKRLWDIKKSKGVISFNDMEKLMIKLLVKDYDEKNDKVIKTDIAKKISQNYDEIIVDEFQDTNINQDIIFRALSNDEKNIFMVGDLKQSIYRFRKANPEVFSKKNDNFSKDNENYRINKPTVIYLNQNFRSAKGIIDFVNFVFEKTMSKQLGDVDYGDDDKLISSELYPSDVISNDFNIFLIDKPENADENELEMNKAQIQAIYVADKIKQLIDEKYEIFDIKIGKKRPIKYSDIAILLKTTKERSSIFENELIKRNIPVKNNNPDESFLESYEVKSVIAFLQVISNPYRDIELITLMTSLFYNYNANELAKIRSIDKNALMWENVLKYAENDEKTSNFVKTINELKQTLASVYSFEIINNIYEKTDIFLKLGQNSDSKNAIENLKIFYTCAQNYEKNNFKGVFSFIKYIEDLMAKNQTIPITLQSGQKENVDILSIHKSKGLEYAVCFMPCLEAGTNMGDISKRILITKDALAFPILKDEKRFKTLAYKIAANSEKEKIYSEQMRLLYVGLTRAKVKLFLSCAYEYKAFSTLMKTIGSSAVTDKKIKKSFLIKSFSYAKVLLSAIANSKNILGIYNYLGLSFNINDNEIPLNLKLFSVSDLKRDSKRVNKKSKSIKLSDISKVKNALEYVYPNENKTKIFSKLSVSEIKGLTKLDEDSEVLIKPENVLKTPVFLTGDKLYDKAYVGLCVHKFLQYCDFQRLKSDGIQSEINRLLKEEFLNQNEALAINKNQIENFINSEIFEKIISSDYHVKEKRFMFKMPYSEIFENSDDDTLITIQGILDCYFVNGKDAVIVDYKTDRLKNENDFINKYKIQLLTYKKAIERSTDLKVSNLYVYSFYLNKTIKISF